MISAHTIRDTIENLHHRFTFDFKDINSHNYREHLGAILHDKNFGEGIKVFAYYSRPLGAPNIHINNYISQLSRIIIEGNDLECLIALDNFLYDDDYVHDEENDYLLSDTIGAARSFFLSQKHEQKSIFPDFYTHYLEKYYGLEKSLSFTKEKHLNGTVRCINDRFMNIISGSAADLSQKEYAALRKLCNYGLSGASLINNEFETYVVNRVAFEGLEKFDKAMKLMSDLTSNGIISADILAKNICFASDSDFVNCLEAVEGYYESYHDVLAAYKLTVKYEAKYSHVHNNFKKRRSDAINLAVDIALDRLGGMEEIAISVNKSLNIFDIKGEPIQSEIIKRLLERSESDNEFFVSVLDHFCKQSNASGISKYLIDYPALKAALPLLSTEQKRGLISEDFGL